MFEGVNRNISTVILWLTVITSKVALYKIDYIYAAHKVLKSTANVKQVQISIISCIRTRI